MQITDFSTRGIVMRNPRARFGQTSSSSKKTTSKSRSKAVAGNFAKRISELKTAMAKLKEEVTASSLGSARSKAGFVRSNVRVTTLDPDGTASTITSAEEVNTTPTSLSTRAPDVQRWTKSGFVAGKSSAQAVLTGTYSDTADATYQIRMDGGVNLDSARQRGRLRFTVRKNGTAVTSVNVLNKNYTNGTELSIGDGLSVFFDGGRVRSGESFFFDAYASVGTDLDPTKAFNGTGAQFSGLSDSTPVVDGSVKINGIEVAVNASDSLDDLMERINSSSAKVEAQFDAATDTITFTNTVDGAKEITFTDDTSGVVAALKLDTATTTLGQDADRTRTIEDVSGLSTVTSGSITINGVEIEIDTSVDTLDDVLTRINDSEAGVKASYSDNTGRLSIASKTTAEDLVVDDDSAGLLSTLNVSTGTYASTRRRGISASKAKALTETMAKMVSELNDIFLQIGGGDSVSAIATTQNDLTRAMRGLVGSSGKTQLGLQFNFSGSGKFIDFDETAQRRFRSALSGNAAAVSTFLNGKGTKDGFFDIIDKHLNTAESSLASEFGTGIVVDTSA